MLSLICQDEKWKSKHNFEILFVSRNPLFCLLNSTKNLELLPTLNDSVHCMNSRFYWIYRTLVHQLRIFPRTEIQSIQSILWGPNCWGIGWEIVAWGAPVC